MRSDARKKLAATFTTDGSVEIPAAEIVNALHQVITYTETRMLELEETLCEVLDHLTLGNIVAVADIAKWRRALEVTA